MTMYKFVNIYSDAGQNRRCVLEIRERCGLLLGQMIVCNFIWFDLIFFFFVMKNILDKVLKQGRRAVATKETRNI